MVWTRSPRTSGQGYEDEVFYTKYIDGPFEFYRFASVYRCLIGLDDNTTTVTKFPMIPDKITATTGDVLDSISTGDSLHRERSLT